MADIQEESSGKIIALAAKGVKFGKDELIAMLKWAIEHTQFRSGNNIEQGEMVSIAHSESTNEVSMSELMAESPNGKLSSLSLDPKDKQEFDKVMRDYGIKYSIKEHPLKDVNGDPVFDYSKCKFEMEEDGITPKLDYSNCKFEKDSVTGKDIIGEDGKPALAPDSPKPQPKLAKGSPEPQQMKQYTVFFQGKNDELMQDAWKSFIEGREAKQKAVEKAEEKREERAEKKQQRKEQREERREERQENRQRDKAEKEAEKYETPMGGAEFTQKYGAENVVETEIQNPKKFKQEADKQGLNYALDVSNASDGIKYKVTFNKKDENTMNKIKNAIKPKVNIKDMIKKNTERANNVNKDNPEKHHNRGEQSL